MHEPLIKHRKSLKKISEPPKPVLLGITFEPHPHPFKNYITFNELQIKQLFIKKLIEHPFKTYMTFM
jgi:hypothetical protein